MATVADDDSEREEELSSLVAIYPELIRDAQDKFCATLELEVAPSKSLLARFIPSSVRPGFDGSYAQAVSHEIAHIEHDVYLSYLPPLRIKIQLPDGYPLTQPPIICLDTQYDWLPQDIIQNLESESSKLWDEYGQCQILFSYIDFLQQSADEGFNLANSAKGCLTLDVAQEKPLVDFDRATALAKFRQGTYDCEICLEPKKGVSCYRMEICRHVFCMQCLQDFYNNAITEGDVVNIRCLSPDCGKDARPNEGKGKDKSTLHPRELLAMGIEEAKVRRYLELKRKKLMEADKTTVYCPRKWCQGAARSPKYPPIPKDLTEYVEKLRTNDTTQQVSTEKTENPSAPNPGDRLAVCEKCELAFCRVCYMGWHGQFQRCYPRDPNELSVEEKASYEYIRLNTSPCPTCGSPTQKTMGCNHMKCFQCNTHFCYLCGSWLLPDNPYIHFNTAGSPCYQRLWELEEGDNGQNPGDGQGFAGGRGYEQMAIEVAREADAREAEAEAARVAAQEVQVHAEREAAELRAFARAEQDDSSDDEIDARLQNVHINANRAQGLPLGDIRGRGGHHRGNPERGQNGRRRGGRAGQHANGHAAHDNVPAGDVDARQLRRFLDLAARDQEDEWDSDELGDERDFIIH